MDKIKRFLKLTKYHFLRLPVIRSIVKWMFRLYINPDPQSQEIHVVKNNFRETICGLINRKKLKSIPVYKNSRKEILREILELRIEKENICERCSSILTPKPSMKSQFLFNNEIS